RAVTTVSGDTRRRARIAATLLSLAGRDDIEVAAGLDTPPTAPGRRAAWMGHEGVGLPGDREPPPISQRDAVTALIEAASGTHLAVIGMHTNIAAALEREPRMAEQIPRLALMGGVFSDGDQDGKGFAPEDDHNLVVDPQAAARVLNSGAMLRYVPGDVTVRTVLTTAQRDRLRRGDRLCRALADLIDRWTPILRRRAPDMPAEQVAALHDPLTVAALVDYRHITIERKPVRAWIEDGIVHTAVDVHQGRPAEIVTDVDATSFAEAWLETVLG
ncbi:MAG TPA: nucleoside hydrolase, partial [Egibacteraceae bacterium]|nr:nucleoside hydrolase [Egibacteraceae bacterium]